MLNDFNTAMDYIKHVRQQGQNKPLTDNEVKMAIINKSEEVIRFLLSHVGLSRCQLDAVMTFHDDFSKVGKSGGGFHYYRNWQSRPQARLRWNLPMAKANFEEYINQVVPHEVAHMIVEVMRRQGFIRKETAHGFQWQKLMVAMKLKPDVCHTMDAYRAKSSTKFEYVGVGCNCKFMFTAVRHNRMKAGKAVIKRNGRKIVYMADKNKTLYTCSKHNNSLKFTGKTETKHAGEKY